MERHILAGGQLSEARAVRGVVGVTEDPQRRATVDRLDQHVEALVGQQPTDEHDLALAGCSVGMKTLEIDASVERHRGALRELREVRRRKARDRQKPRKNRWSDSLSA